MTTQAQTLWNFSLRTYARAGVARSCLALQNRSGCDVNLLLFCCWGGLNFGALPDPVLDEAVAYSQRWSTEVVRPLRGVRGWMKGRDWETAAAAHETLRDRIKSVELEAERLQQVILEYLVRDLVGLKPDSADGLEAIVDNLGRYLQHAGIVVDAAACDDLAVLVHAALPSLDFATVRRGLERLGVEPGSRV